MLFAIGIRACIFTIRFCVTESSLSTLLHLTVKFIVEAFDEVDD